MMVRRFSLIVPVLAALGVAGAASAQPTQVVGPWSTLERVGETLQGRQERKDEVVDRVEESYPEFYARNSGQLDQPLLLTPMRLAGWSVGSATVGSPAPAVEQASAPAPPPPPSAPTRARFVPYQPLVLGSFFGGGGVVAPPTPEPMQAPAPSPAPRPVSAPKPAPAPRPTAAPKPTPARPITPRPASPPPPTPEEPADAYLNFSDGPFPAAESLAEGEPAAWHRSPVVSDLLGRAPNAQEQQGFKADVVAKVEDRFRSSGIDVDLISEPGPASHTLSVVSGALAKDNTQAIGLADIGGDGFTFLDNFDTAAIDSVDDLETAVANNISHELMHTFGVDFHHESGETIDSGTIPWDLLTDEDLAFSGDAVALLSSADFQGRWDDLTLAGAQLPSHGQGCSCHPNGAHATPEPATLAMWAITLLGASWSGRRWRRARG
ncbi:hypothetical protein [Tautonia plasticadhaerens]|uniref:PEP-CTERM protein-sorting domain-containing protein n=1 Tax=Tautonia plasticadhaerens TaxID=2527974 RepID=A0A518GZE1_9BACT|nr:hypothetical protein [Tautonia plasticadhaerens]QDV33922.1 hypothetical protein ElP_18030 [Tautonia plasticadhaerens]